MPRDTPPLVSQPAQSAPPQSAAGADFYLRAGRRREDKIKRDEVAIPTNHLMGSANSPPRNASLLRRHVPPSPLGLMLCCRLLLSRTKGGVPLGSL